MFNSSTIINKTNNHLWSQTIEHKTWQCPGLGMAQKCGRVKMVSWIPT